MTHQQLNFDIARISPKDQPWVAEILCEHWGSTKIVSRGKIHIGDQLPGFILRGQGKPLGLITYHIDGNQCEITTLNSFKEKMGIGTALIEAVKSISKEIGCTRLWLITTNDNINAIRFYQKCGFKLVAVHQNAIQLSRSLKPTSRNRI